jgi:hypothetical protein
MPNSMGKTFDRGFGKMQTPRVVEGRINTSSAYRAASPPLTLAFVMSYDSCLDYCSVGGPTVLKFSPYDSGGNSTKGSGSGSKSGSDF